MKKSNNFRAKRPNDCENLVLGWELMVFVHFLCDSDTELRIYSSFLQILFGFFQIMERLRIFAAHPVQKCA